MNRSQRIVFLAFIAYLAAFITGHSAASAAPSDPAPSGSEAAEGLVQESQSLLEKGLSVYELERQLQRLSAKEKEVAASILETEKSMELQQQKVDRLREQSGKVLQSYYMGERDALVYSIFGSGSLNEAFVMLDFVQMIFESDQEKLRSHMEAYLKLDGLRKDLLSAQSALAEVKFSYLAQLEERLRLKGELESGLAGHADAEEIRRQITQLAERWESEGLPLFRDYFRHLAGAMKDLPEIVSSNPNHLTRQKGTTFLFKITDAELNRFLRSKDPLFDRLTFEFDEGTISANGRDEGISMRMVGRYVLETEPENLIRYEVEELWFDGFRLPEGTGQELEEQFPLGFYPKYIDDSLAATSVETEDGELRVTLQVDIDRLF